MPSSNADGRDWLYQRIRDTAAAVIVDGGAGEGTHSVLARHLRLEAEWVAVEVFEPYLDRFLLADKYDRVVLGDLRYQIPDLPHRDYVILLGDVLEHMTRDEAVALLAFHMEHATDIYVSVPIVYAPQGTVHDNPHEAHLHHWHFEEMLEVLPGCESFRGVIVGRYWWHAPHTTDLAEVADADLP